MIPTFSNFSRPGNSSKRSRSRSPNRRSNQCSYSPRKGPRHRYDSNIADHLELLPSLVEKYSSQEPDNPDASSTLKQVLTSVLQAPDIRNIISSLPEGFSKDRLLQKIIEEQLTAAVVSNPEFLSQITPDQPEPPENSLAASNELPLTKFKPVESHDQPTPLSIYIRSLFENNSIHYRPETTEEIKPTQVQLLVDYKAKFMTRSDDARILPSTESRPGLDMSLYCQFCRKELGSQSVKTIHDKSYLHQILTGSWWTCHPKPPTFLPLFKLNSRSPNLFIWCVVCFERHCMESNEVLFQHLKSSHHQFNLHCWKECFNSRPEYEWCLWGEVEARATQLPVATVNGFDWVQEVRSSVVPVPIKNSNL